MVQRQSALSYAHPDILNAMQSKGQAVCWTVDGRLAFDQDLPSEGINS